MQRQVKSVLLMIGLSCLALLAGCQQVATTPDRPRMVVVVVVDQMRADHMTRFAGLYRHGLARLWREGAVFVNGHQDHAYTVTGAGHATISTGAFPSTNGIVGNEWYDLAIGRTVYCSEDTTATLLGVDSAKPTDGRSPALLQTPALGDWLKAVSPASKVFAVSRKDRGAIFSAGLNGDGAYWYHSKDGRFITSSYYADAYPGWVDSFNAARVADRYFAEGWHKSRPEEDYFAAREDDFPAEADGKRTTFPHRFTDRSQAPDARYYAALTATPFTDQVTVEFAKKIVEHEQLGTDDSIDLLVVSCSSVDAVGHSFGPLSQESMDTFMRLDEYLGDLFGYLDAVVGKENYLVAFTSDHGVMPMPEELARRGIEAKRIHTMDVRAQVATAAGRLMQKLGISEPVITGYSGYGLLVNYEAVAGKGLTPAELDRLLAEELRQESLIEDVFTTADLENPAANEREFIDAYRRSYFPGRGGNLVMRLKKYYLVAGSHGTTHGSPYDYDTRVPIVFAGPGITPGIHDDRVRTVDIAPTLAELLGIPTGDRVDGASLLEIIRR